MVALRLGCFKRHLIADCFLNYSMDVALAIGGDVKATSLSI